MMISWLINLGLGLGAVKAIMWVQWAACATLHYAMLGSQKIMSLGPHCTIDVGDQQSWGNCSGPFNETFGTTWGSNLYMFCNIFSLLKSLSPNDKRAGKQICILFRNTNLNHNWLTQSTPCSVSWISFQAQHFSSIIHKWISVPAG